MVYKQESIKPYNDYSKKSEQVRTMFDRIAPTYDELNSTFSFGIDKYWRRKAINSLKPYAPKTILDVATGTGDFALLAMQLLHPKKIIGIDLSDGMLEIGRKKIQERDLSKQIEFKNDDCLNLSFSDNSFDAVTVAYGVRNFSDLDKGLSEIYRVLKPKGRLVIVELCTPKKFPMNFLFKIYAKVIMSKIGAIISKDTAAYSYLTKTMAVFPQGKEMKKILEQAKFTKVNYKTFTFGLSTLYCAEK